MNYSVNIKWLGRKVVYKRWSSNRYNVSKLYYIHKGSCYYTVGGKRVRLDEGKLYLIPATSDFSPYSDEADPLDHSYVDFEIIPPISVPGLYVLDPDSDSLTRIACELFLALTEKENVNLYFDEVLPDDAELLASSIAFLVKKFIQKNEIPITKYDELAMAMMTDLIENISVGISVDELAKKYFMTRESVIRKFKRSFNMTPHAYLKRLRLNTASYLLQSGKKLSDVAHEVGYADSSSLLHAMNNDKEKSAKKINK